MGIVTDGRTKFDERLRVKEDYELTLHCVKEDGGVVAGRYCFGRTRTGRMGGCAVRVVQLLQRARQQGFAGFDSGDLRSFHSTFSTELFPPNPKRSWEVGSLGGISRRRAGMRSRNFS
jgi:hypothetical protein